MFDHKIPRIITSEFKITQVEEYMEALEEIMIKREDGIRLMPEMYAVPGDKVSQNTYSSYVFHCKCVVLTTTILYVVFFSLSCFYYRLRRSIKIQSR